LEYERHDTVVVLIIGAAISGDPGFDERITGRWIRLFP